MTQSLTSDTYECQYCPACETGAFRSLDVPNRWIGEPVFSRCRDGLGLSECTGCGLVLTRPRPSSQLLTRFYSGADYRCHTDADRHDVSAKADVLLERVERYTAAGQRLLDFGCGSGWLLDQARERGWCSTGYDPGVQALDTCLARGLEVVGDLDRLEPGSFDAIVLHHVFEHLEDPRQTLTRLDPLLSEAGAVFIEVPNSASLRARLSAPPLTRLGFDERFRAFPIHLFYFTPETLARLLDACGYELISIETYGLGIDELIAWRGWMPSSASTPGGRAGRSPQWRQVVKRHLFAAGLGENILAAARPRRRTRRNPLSAGKSDSSASNAAR